MQTATIELTGTAGSRPTWSPSPGTASPRGCRPRRARRWRRAPPWSQRLAASDEPVYGVSTGFGSLAHTWIPAERRERAAARARSARTRRAWGRRSSARWCGRCCSCAPARWRWAAPAPGRWSPRRMLALLAAGPRPGRARARLARRERRPGAARPLRARADRRGRGARRRPASARRRPRRSRRRASSRSTLDRQGGARAHQRHRRDPRHARARARTTSRRLLKVADVDRGHVHRGAARHGPRVRRGPRAHCARSRARRRARPTCAELLAGSPIVASHRHDDPRVQDAYSLRCTPQVHGAARDTWRTCDGVAAAELRSAIDNPMVLPDGRVESCGNFHGAPVGDRVRLPRHRRGRGRRDRRAPHRPAARRGALARAAAVPDRGRGRELGDDARPVHAGRDGRREPAARRAGQRRLAPHERDAGGPRVDGVGRGAQAAHGRGQPRAASSRSSSPAPRAALDLRAPLEPGAGTAAARDAVRARGRRVPAPTAGWRPSSRPSRRSSRRARWWRPWRARSGGLE